MRLGCRIYTCLYPECIPNFSSIQEKSYTINLSLTVGDVFSSQFLPAHSHFCTSSYYQWSNANVLVSYLTWCIFSILFQAILPVRSTCACVQLHLSDSKAALMESQPKWGKGNEKRGGGIFGSHIPATLPPPAANPIKTTSPPTDLTTIATNATVANVMRPQKCFPPFFLSFPNNPTLFSPRVCP